MNVTDSDCHSIFRKVVDIIRAQEQSRNLHEQFHHQLESTDDGFAVVADYFGRGVFSKLALSNAEESSLAAFADLDVNVQRQLLIPEK